MRRSTGAGSHQLALPKRCIKDGTSTVRRMKASMKTATARPMPNSAMTRCPPNTNATNTPIMIAAAAVITRPVVACPVMIEWRLSCVCTHSSCMRLTRNTW